MSTTKVHIISSSTIKIPHHNKNETTPQINLTPWDLELLHLEYNQCGVVFRKPTNNSCSTSLINHLKLSLQQTLQFFPPLTGHLMITTTAVNGNAATSFSVDCCNDNASPGVLFIHATVVHKDANFTVSDILDTSTYVPEVVNSFFPLMGVRNHEGVTQPLLAVQVTELVDGFFMGWSINHLTADGTSFWRFFNSWAEISRDIINNVTNPISTLPLFNRDQITLELTGSNSIGIDNKDFIFNQNVVNDPTCQLKERVFCFSKQSVAKLKAKANQEILISKGKKKISSLQAIVAHVWRSIMRYRFSINPDDGQETTFEIPMGARQRLNPPLPEEYFGNAVFPGIVTIKASEILENGLGWTALQINKMVASSNCSDRVKEFYMSWIKEPKFLNFEGLQRNHFILINSPRFDVYGSDFGWGEPVAVRSGRANSFDGRITVFGGVEKGSMEIQAYLFSETLCALAEDPEFMEFVQS